MQSGDKGYRIRIVYIVLQKYVRPKISLSDGRRFSSCLFSYLFYMTFYFAFNTLYYKKKGNLLKLREFITASLKSGESVTMSEKRRFHLIACEIMFREVCLCAAKSCNVIDLTFMPKKLHDLGEAKMSGNLQRQIDQIDPEKYDAILLCYGLCNYGVRGLHAEIPIVIPRAHDCITLLMGSKDKYKEYFAKNPGTFFHSTGWIERDSDEAEGIASQLGINKSYEEYRELYGEDAAEYLTSVLGSWRENYKKIAYINTGTGDHISNLAFSKKSAEAREWEFDEVEGDLELILKLFNGEWDDIDFLVAPPQYIIEPSYDETIIRCARKQP